MNRKLDKQINKWFISPNAENKEYITHFFNKIIKQLIEEKSTASKKELVPKCSEDPSFINDLEIAIRLNKS